MLKNSTAGQHSVNVIFASNYFFVDSGQCFFFSKRGEIKNYQKLIPSSQKQRNFALDCTEIFKKDKIKLKRTAFLPPSLLPGITLP